MLEGFQKKMETIAENYADLINKSIVDLATEEFDYSEKTQNEMFTYINDGIRLLNHIANTLERINRVQNDNSTHGMN